jgi:hypothetical protein
MRRSQEIELTLLAALALSMTACREQHKDCVDANNRKVDDSYCEMHTSVAHYVYGGSSGGHVGDTVVGASSSSVGSAVRGGFGGSGGSGHGAGGGGE